LLQAQGARVEFHDPHIPAIRLTRGHSHLAGQRSVPLTPKKIAGADLILVATAHDAVNYRLVAKHARLIVDTRNVLAKQLKILQSISRRKVCFAQARRFPVAEKAACEVLSLPIYPEMPGGSRFDDSSSFNFIFLFEIFEAFGTDAVRQNRIGVG